MARDRLTKTTPVAEALGDDVDETAFAAGAALRTDEAVAYVRRARSE